MQEVPLVYGALRRSWKNIKVNRCGGSYRLRSSNLVKEEAITKAILKKSFPANNSTIKSGQLPSKNTQPAMAVAWCLKINSMYLLSFLPNCAFIIFSNHAQVGKGEIKAKTQELLCAPKQEITMASDFNQWKSSVALIHYSPFCALFSLLSHGLFSHFPNQLPTHIMNQVCQWHQKALLAELHLLSSNHMFSWWGSQC